MQFLVAKTRERDVVGLRLDIPLDQKSSRDTAFCFVRLGVGSVLCLGQFIQARQKLASRETYLRTYHRGFRRGNVQIVCISQVPTTFVEMVIEFIKSEQGVKNCRLTALVNSDYRHQYVARNVDC